jgi:hypothetical protein
MGTLMSYSFPHRECELDLLRAVTITSHRRRSFWQKMLQTQRANLVGYWPLNGNAQDYSGHGFHGSALNVTWGAGIGDGGQAAVFAGAGRINLFSAGLAAAFNPLEGTLYAWFKVSALADWSDAAYRDVVYLLANDNNKVELGKRSAADQVMMLYKASAVSSSLNYAMNPANPVTWCQMAVTWNKVLDRAVMYVTGTAPTTRNALGVWVGSLTLAVIGANALAATQPWKGSVAHVGVWNAELSIAQLDSLATYASLLSVRRDWLVDVTKVGAGDAVG